MGLQLTLEWFDKTTELLVDKEISADLGDDGSLIIKFGLPFDSEIYYGGYDVLPSWKPDLQPLFKHQIDFFQYNYQLVFSII